MNNRRALLLKADIKRKLTEYDSVHIESDMDKHGFEIEDFGENNELMNYCLYSLLLEDSPKTNILSNNIHWILSCIKESEIISVNNIGGFGVSHIQALQFCLFSLTKNNIFREIKDNETIEDIKYKNLLNTYKLFSGKDFKFLTIEDNLNNQYNIIKNFSEISNDNYKKILFEVIDKNINFLSDMINLDFNVNIPQKILAYESKMVFFDNVIEILNIFYNGGGQYVVKGHALYSAMTKTLIDKKDDKAWYTSLKVLIINSKIPNDENTEYLIDYFNANIDKEFKEKDWPLYTLLLKNNHLDFPSLYQRKLLKIVETNIDIDPAIVEPYKKKLIRDRI